MKLCFFRESIINIKTINLTDIIIHSLKLNKKNTINFILSLVELILRDETINHYKLAKLIMGKLGMLSLELDMLEEHKKLWYCRKALIRIVF